VYHLCVLHKLGEAELQVVLHIVVEEIVGNVLRSGLQKWHQQGDYILLAPRSAWRGRRGDGHMNGPCTHAS